MRARSRMTVAELKTHVDRRLRKKADKADLRALEERMNARFQAVDDRFQTVDRRFNAVMDKLERIEHKIGAQLERIEHKLEDVERNTRHHKTILDNHERRLTDLEARPTA